MSEESTTPNPQAKTEAREDKDKVQPYFRILYDKAPLNEATQVQININLNLAAAQKNGRQTLHGTLMETIEDIHAIVMEKQIKHKQGGLTLPNGKGKDVLKVH
jgi:hypothetical protein